MSTELQDSGLTEQTKLNRGKLRHYVFEFIMLFLAVTMGFFVENQREQMSEREQERKLMKTLLADLKKDTERIDQIIQLRTERIRKNDSLYLLLHSPDRKQYIERIYQYMKSANSRGTLFYQSNTMIYLANGGFQRISSDSVADKTREYYFRVQDFLASQESGHTIATALTQQNRGLLNAETSWKLDHARKPGEQVNLDLYSTRPDFVNEYCNTLMHFNGNNRAQIRFLNKMHEQAEALAHSIRQEYKIQ